MIIAIIPARGGSKAIPGKNIKLLKKKPLIAHSIERAKECKLIDRVIVSTDDDKIASVAEKHGAEVQKRPAMLARDDTPMIPVLKFVVEEIEKQGTAVDIVVLLQPTNPFRKTEHIIAAIEKIKEGFGSATTMTRVGIKPVCIAEIGKNGKCRFKNTSGEVLRQKIEEYYVDGTVFAYKKEALMALDKIPWSIENNAGIIINQSESLDIDEPIDFEIAEFLMSR